MRPRKPRDPSEFAETPKLTIYVCCMEPPAAHPEWKGKEWVRCDDPAMVLSHNESCRTGEYDKLHNRWVEAANRIARKIMANEAGVWIGRVRDASNDPRPDRILPREDRAAMDAHILNGPNGPGRRYLQDLRDRPNASKLAVLAANLKSVPSAEKPRTVATREMIERLKTPPVVEHSGPYDADLWAMQDDLPGEPAKGDE